MNKYLTQFDRKLKKEYRGSVVKVNTIKDLEPNAKEYLNKLAKAGYIDRVTWGWYWIPDEYKDFFDFLKKDKNFKVLSGQSAASFWDYDFVHREIHCLKVGDRSYKKALETFAKSKGWEVEVDYIRDISESNYVKRGGIYVETREKTIIECLQRWAFLDAFAVLFTHRNKIKLEDLNKRAYWTRIERSDVRVRQVLEYGACKLYQLLGEPKFKTRKITLKDEFIRTDIDEAIERVVEFA
jgi:predicted transcriptional regulator of viral defense system